MSEWYVNVEGQAQGPYSKEDLVQKVIMGECSALDLVFKVGTTEWKPIGEETELNTAVEAIRQKEAEEKARAEEQARLEAEKERLRIEEERRRAEEELRAAEEANRLKAEQERQMAEAARQKVEQERQMAEATRLRMEQEQALAAKKAQEAEAAVRAAASSSSPTLPFDELENSVVQKPEWVLLRKVVIEGKKQFKQVGPYTQMQVMQMLEEGKIQFQDHAWKAGMADWQRVGQIETFKVPLPSSPPLETVVYDAEAFRAEKNKMSGESNLPADSNNQSKNPWPEQPQNSTKSSAQSNTSQDSDSQNALLQTDSLESSTPSQLGQAQKQERTLADLVEIEKFERQKTHVMSAAELRQQWTMEEAKGDQPTKNASEEEDWSIAPGGSKGAARQTVSPVVSAVPASAPASAPASLQKQPPMSSSVPPGGEVKIEGHSPEGSVDVFSEGPGLVTKISSFITSKLDREPTEIQGTATAGLGFEDTAEGRLMPNMPFSPNLKYGAVVGVLVLSLVFFIRSLFSGGEGIPVAQEDGVVSEEGVASDFSEETAEEKLAAFQEKKQWEQRQREEALQNEIALLKSKQNSRGAVAKNTSKRASSSKKSSITKVSKPATKKAAQPKAQVASTSSRANDGSLRSRSFYMHRDRLNLFYSSENAEKQVSSIEENFKKLKRKPKEWKTFYSSWKKDLKNGVSSSIRNYPSKGITYGYPKTVKSFHQDYKDLLVYGELHNAKVNGTRLPASPGKRFDKVFSQHKDAAKGLSFR